MRFSVPRWTLAPHKGGSVVAQGTARPRIDADYSMTWSFAGPDGQVLFRLAEVAGETVVVWLRVGSHGIYDS
jgi:hypothetical protein